MLLKNKLDKIKTLINSDSVLTKMEERYCYSTDASNIESNIKVPDLVVFVETIEEVQQVLKYASEYNIPVISRGAGTNMVGACACTEGGIILNFSKMNKVLDFNSINMTIRVQPGVLLGDIKALAEKHGLFYPPDPSNFMVSTIGGSIAQSSGGAKAFKYGTTKDYVLSLKLVTADGKIMTVGTKTTKNSVGYHLAQLIVGSEGTLAVIVEATLKLIPRPQTNQLILAYFATIQEAINSVNNILKEQIFPASIDFMDKNSMITVENFMKCDLQTENEAIILLELDGTESGILEDSKRVCEVFKRAGATNISIPIGEAMENVWKARRASYAATTRLAPDVISDDIIVPRDKLSIMIDFCSNLAKKYKLQLCLVGHVGDGNLHPQIALNLDDENEFRNYMEFKSELYSKVLELQGTISAEHGIGISKLPYINVAMDASSIEYMKLIKKVFDPKNILNPGKIFQE